MTSELRVASKSASPGVPFEQHVTTMLETVVFNQHVLYNGQRDIYDMLATLNQKEDAEMADLTALTAEVTNTTTVEESAIVLLNGLAAQLTAALTDPAAIQALADQLTSESTSLAAAVAANTPAQPATP